MQRPIYIAAPYLYTEKLRPRGKETCFLLHSKLRASQNRDRPPDWETRRRAGNVFKSLGASPLIMVTAPTEGASCQGTMPRTTGLRHPCLPCAQLCPRRGDGLRHSPSSQLRASSPPIPEGQPHCWAVRKEPVRPRPRPSPCPVSPERSRFTSLRLGFPIQPVDSKNYNRDSEREKKVAGTREACD